MEELKIFTDQVISHFINKTMDEVNDCNCSVEVSHDDGTLEVVDCWPTEDPNGDMGGDSANIFTK